MSKVIDFQLAKKEQEYIACEILILKNDLSRLFSELLEINNKHDQILSTIKQKQAILFKLLKR